MARIIEEYLDFGAIEPDEAGNSEAVTVDNVASLSCQAIYTVDTPTGATVTFQKSNDGTNWVAIQAATAISANGSVMLDISVVTFKYFRAVKAISSGDVTLTCLLCANGY